MMVRRAFIGDEPSSVDVSAVVEALG